MQALVRPLASAALSLFVSFVAATSATAQALPPGSYQRTCEQIHWAGTTLVAECRRADGRLNGTGLPNANRCAGDIGNNGGQLQCTYAGGAQSPGSSPVPRGPAPPPQGYNPPGYLPPEGYGPAPAPGYPPPAYGGYDERRARCEELWHRGHELRDRLQYEPYGPDRDRLEYRLHETYKDRERLGCEH